jgi:hypothetical protein
MDPAAGLDFAFDSVNSPDTFWEAASMDRSRVVGSGNHTVVVQWAVTTTATTFRLRGLEPDDRTGAGLASLRDGPADAG